MHEKEKAEWNGKNHLANIQRIPLVTEIQAPQFGLNNRSTIDGFGVISPRMEVKRAKQTSMLPMEFLPSLSGQTFVRKKVLNDQDDYFQHEHLNVPVLYMFRIINRSIFAMIMILKNRLKFFRIFKRFQNCRPE